MNRKKKFFLNGQTYYLIKNINISELIIYLNYESTLFVLEYNKFICERKNWKNVYIKNSDKIEIITIVGGG